MYKIIVIGGSAGSFPLIQKLLAKLPASYNTPIVLCLHRLKHIRHGFVEALNLKSAKQIIEPDDKEKIQKGRVYLAPANYHLMADIGNIFSLSTSDMVSFSRPSINVAFDTFSYIFKEKMLGVILSGANSDGAMGLYMAKKRGAKVITQSPAEATIKTMPEAAIHLMPDIKQLNIDEIIEYILSHDSIKIEV